MTDHNKTIRSEVIFYLFITCFIILFMNPQCQRDGNSIKYDPLQGYLINSSGQAVSGAKVFQGLYNDSTQSSVDGSYTLGKGIPNFYSEATVSCQDQPKYISMDEFSLTCIHPLYDTTVAIFVDSILYHPADWRFSKDTIFTGPATNYGNIGSLRHIPTIVMKSKTH